MQIWKSSLRKRTEKKLQIQNRVQSLGSCGASEGEPNTEDLVSFPVKQSPS